MSAPIRAITLDLDDTLWPIEPVIRRAETIAQTWFRDYAPRVLAHYSAERRAQLRAELIGEFPSRAHDLGWLRQLQFARMLEHCGYDPAQAQTVFTLFLTARQQVELYEGTHAALVRLAARYPLAAISNGNADLSTIGLHQHFTFSLSASDYGAAKPDPGIYREACRRLGCAPENVLHVGDDPHTDVYGAYNAGLRTAWINRNGAAWAGDISPEFVAAGLAELAEQLHPISP
jgi:FMN hydrolase / 5-amino-6-(5-phospho-D-ribitylamino)uracil phosphatase